MEDGGEYALDRLQDRLEDVRDSGCDAHFDSWVLGFLVVMVVGIWVDGVCFCLMSSWPLWLLLAIFIGTEDGYWSIWY